jgi:hypothetical protein
MDHCSSFVPVMFAGLQADATGKMASLRQQPNLQSVKGALVVIGCLLHGKLTRTVP